MVESTKSPKVCFSYQESQQSSLKKRSLIESSADTKKQGGATKKQKIDEPPVTEQATKTPTDVHMASIEDQEKTLQELRANHAAFYSDIQSKAYREGEHFAKLLKN